MNTTFTIRFKSLRHDVVAKSVSELVKTISRYGRAPYFESMDVYFGNILLLSTVGNRISKVEDLILYHEIKDLEFAGERL